MCHHGSPDWTLHFSSSTNVHVHHLNVHNPLEPNADGIEIDSSQNVLVEVSLGLPVAEMEVLGDREFVGGGEGI